ncbi:MAG TPA: hypothetical protein VFV73_19165 [Streptosporangiaceae bacterium]|nr:hypothetical protein [Streptosporangiaceae bacterium]
MRTTAWCAPAIGFTSDAALIFYGASMLLPLPAATPGVRCWPS